MAFSGGTGEAVEQKAALAMEASGPLTHHRHDQRVGDQFPPLHGRQGSREGWAGVGVTPGGPEHVAR